MQHHMTMRPFRMSHAVAKMLLADFCSADNVLRVPTPGKSVTFLEIFLIYEGLESATEWKFLQSKFLESKVLERF